MAKKFDVVAVTVYRSPVAKVCNDCPFRKKAMPGWLGASSPEGFMDCINRDEPLPCHQTIDYEDPAWKTKWVAQQNGSMCAGALIMTANMAKLPADKNFPRLPVDRETVFASPLDFVRHHREAIVQSWDDEEQSDETKYLHKVYTDAAKRVGKPFKKAKKR